MLTERAFRLADARDALAVEWDERLRRTRDECAALGGDPSSLRVVPDVSAGWFRLESATPAAVDGVAFHGFLIAEEAAYLSRLVGTDPEPPHPPSVVIPPAAFAPVSGGGHDAPAILSVDVEHIPDPDGEPCACGADDCDLAGRYATGEYGFIGIRATAEVIVNGTVQTITSGGLWGVEDFASGDYLAEIEREELSDLRDTLAAMGCDVTGEPDFAGLPADAPPSHSDADLVARQAARDACECCGGPIADDTYGRRYCLGCGDAIAEFGAEVAAGEMTSAEVIAVVCPRCTGTGYEHDGPRCIGCDGARVVTA